MIFTDLLSRLYSDKTKAEADPEAKNLYPLSYYTILVKIDPDFKRRLLLVYKDNPY